VLRSSSLEENLQTQECQDCGGHWVQAFQYWRWLDAHGPNLPEKPADEIGDLELCDSEETKVCPECTRLTMHCRVGHGVDFYLDRCSHCGGIWFDRNEWAALKARNLHDDTHYIFSNAWQDRLRREEQSAQREARVRDLLGDDAYDEVGRFKIWLATQEHRALILGYLRQGEV
jgi:Zn-finger nucleic acid-binding protein